jgi:hypothetical protein
MKPRKVCRCQIDQAAHAHNCQRHAKGGTEQRQHPGLDENLARDPSAAGAQRGPYCVLFCSRERSAERQAGNVPAGNQQHAGHAAEHGEQHGARGADDIVHERRRGCPPAGVSIRPSPFVVARLPFKVRVGLLEGDTVGQACHGVDEPALPAQVRRVDVQWNPEVSSLPVRQGALLTADMLQSGADDTNDHERPPRQMDDASDDSRVGAEPRAPHSFAENRLV